MVVGMLSNIQQCMTQPFSNCPLKERHPKAMECQWGTSSLLSVKTMVGYSLELLNSAKCLELNS